MVAVTVPVLGLTETVETVDVAPPVTEVVAGVNNIGWLALVVAATIFTFCPVVANPVRFPVCAPLNVVAATVPFDGLIVTVDTVDVAAPETVPVAGVNVIGWARLVVAATTFMFLPVVANPVTFPVRFPEKAPENVVAVTVPVDGVTNTVVTEDVAAPETEVPCGLNVR